MSTLGFVPPIEKAKAVGTTITISDSGGTRNWNDTASWVGGVVPTVNDDIVATATSGNLTINVAAAAKSIDLTNYVGILTHNTAITLTVSGNLLFATGMTYTLGNATTSAIAFNASANITTAGKTLGNITFNNSGGTFQLQDALIASGSLTLTAGTFDPNGKVVTLTGATPTVTGGFTFYDLTRTGNAVTTNSLTFTADQTITHTLTLTGNSAINRLLITSNTLGTARTITAANVSLSNTDFRDITFAGVMAGTASSTSIGDAGGNNLSVNWNTTNFPTAATTTTWDGTANLWSSAHWDVRVPLPQDTVVLAGTNIITANMPRLGKDISFSAAAKLSLGSGNILTSYGSVNFTNAGTFTNGNSTWIFESQARIGTLTFTSSSKIFAGLTIQVVGATLQLADSLSCSTISFNNGTFNDAGNSISATYMTISTVNVARGVTKTGNWTLTRSTAGSVWIAGATTGLSWSDTGGSITISNTGANIKIFQGAGLTYNNLIITGGGTGAVIITGSNTFNNFTIGAPKTVTLPSTVITTINGIFTAVGTAGNVITINSDSAGAAAILSKASGTVISDYLSIKDSTTMGGAVWFAGNHSTDVSGNSGWIFRSPEIVSNAGGNWSEAVAWVGGIVPTADDYVFATATSGNLTIDANASCRDIDLRNYTATLTHAAGVTLSVGNASGGSLKFVAGMTYAVGSNTTSVINFVSNTTGNTISWGGKSVGSVIFNGVGGGWSFQDAAIINGNLQMDTGTLTIGCTSFLVAGSQIINGGTLVNSQAEYDYFKSSIDSATHNDYGAAYPITYDFGISPNSSNLKVYKKYTTSQSWTQITEKTSSDFFNAIEAARFDYPNNQAYISVAFSSESDDIYLKITDDLDNLVCANYQDIPKYYDNRAAAVTVTSDDWYHTYDSAFQAASDAFASRSIWLTPGIITNYVPIWSNIQNKINAGYIEPASHSRNHGSPPYLDYDSEIGGSRDDIINNLDLPALNKKGDQEYVYAWLEPNGTSDSTIRSKLGQYKYLADRSTGDSDVFATWDAVNGVYNRIGTSYQYNQGTLAAANSKFDAVVSAGGIYHLWGHPYSVSWTPGSWILDHLDYIKEKTNLWYVGFGHLYLYHYLDSQNKVSVGKIQVVTSTVTTQAATDLATTTATGNGNITDTGGGAMEQGFKYGLTEADTWSASDIGDFGTGPYTKGLTGLSANTIYHIRAFATNSAGTGYGAWTTFTTPLAGGHGSKKKAVSEVNPSTPVSTVIPTNESIVAEITQTLHDYNVSAPTASFTMSSDNTTGSTVTFDASGSTSNKGIVKYEWDFGDGTTAEGMKVEYQYKSPGRYTVTLTVTDRAGNKNTTTKTVDIKPIAPTITNITAKSAALWIEGKSDPGTTIYFTIHSNPFEGQGLANKDGYWTYFLDNASDVLGAGDHTIFALAAVKLADNSELRGAPSKTYDFKMSVDNGKLKVETQKTRIWQIVSGISIIIIIIIIIIISFISFLVLKRRRTQKY